jgi:beta-galactosidase
MKTSLNFSWKFINNFKEEYLKQLPEEAEIVNIPHCAFEVPYNYFNELSYQDVVTYEKIFDVTNLNKDRKYLIRFDGLMVQARIYFNDYYLGNHVSAYIPFEIDVTDYIKEKDNRLLVIVDSREDENVPPFGFAIDYVTYSGIYREVYLIDEPKTYLRNIYVHGDMDGNVDIIYDKIGNDEIKVHHSLIKDEKTIKEVDTDKFKVDNIKLWDLDHPELYTLETTLEVDGDKETDRTRFGFRNSEFTNHGYYLNGKKIKLIGLNRHQGYPYIGYAASKSLQEDDANILKYEAGVNIVRTSHYPQSEHFLNRCDEIGLLNINEIPGWQHIGKSEQWRHNCVNNARVMVLTQRNHPSLIAHGVRIDESIDDKELYTETNRVAHELDKYRPTIGVRNFTNSELLEDIYGYNDFACGSLKIGLLNPKKVKHLNKPLLVTEYMGHMDPVKPYSDLEKRIEVALRHAKVINDNFKYENTCGAIGWCFADYHTHTDFGSGDHICPHGVFDLYRNPKYSAYVYASQQDEIPVLKVISNMKPGDIPAALFGDIYVVTNCDYIELYKNDEYVTTFKANKKQFESLKHPPILIDDLIGETFNVKKFPPRARKTMAKMLSYAAIHGYNNQMPLRIKAYLAYALFRYKISYPELVGYWNEFVGAWGGKAKTYKIKGFKNGKQVAEAEVGPSNDFEMIVSQNKDSLHNEDTYDTLKIRIQHVDSHHNVMEYSQRIVSIETSGPIELIGPNNQTLLGGQLSVYIKSKNEKGTGKVTIKMDNFVKTITVPVD